MFHGAELAAGHYVLRIDFANLTLLWLLLLLLSHLLHGKRVHLRDSRLDLLELCAVLAVAFPGIFANRLPNQFHPIPRIRVVTEKLRPTRSTFLFKLGEKLDHGKGVVTGVVHDLRT